jgi:transcription antitermination factor NusA-like protein
MEGNRWEEVITQIEESLNCILTSPLRTAIGEALTQAQLAVVEWDEYESDQALHAMRQHFGLAAPKEGGE